MYMYVNIKVRLHNFYYLSFFNWRGYIVYQQTLSEMISVNQLYINNQFVSLLDNIKK